MDHVASTTLESIRQSIHQRLTEMGCDMQSLQEAILIRGGLYCGRRFTCPTGAAVWFIEEQQIKYYSADGALAEVAAVPTTEQSKPAVVEMPLRRAA